MADDRISMPSGMGGLVRYFDEYKSKIRIKPAYIVLLIALVIVLELGLWLIK
jgi:preprotein translocase subunit Sec61beta